MGNKHSKKPKLPEPTASEGLYQSVLNTEIYNSQDSLYPNSDEAIEAIEEIMNASHKNDLLPNVQAFMSNSIYTGPFQLDHQSNNVTILDDTETTDDFQAVPCDETTQNCRMNDSQLPTAVEATERIQEMKESGDGSQSPYGVQSKEPIKSFEITIGTQTDLTSTKEAYTQTEEDITEDVAKFFLDVLTEFSKIEQDNNSSAALITQSSFVTKNKQQIQSLVASLQTLLSKTDFAPKNFTSITETSIQSPSEAADVSDIEPSLENETTNHLETDPELQSKKSDVSSIEDEQVDRSNESENIPEHIISSIEHLETMKPSTSTHQFSMVSNTEELPTVPKKKKTLWKKFKKGISKPLRIFKR